MVRGPILALGLLLQLLPSASGFLKGGPAFVTSAGLHSVFHPRRSARVCPAGPSLRMEAPRLGSVVMPPCKKLCPGCEPWICPLAPQEEGDAKTPHSESAARLLELMKEDAVRAELVLQKAQLEEIAAGVKEIVSKEEWEAVVAQSTQEDLVAVVFWGGSWCRKCQALKPKFVSLAANLGNEQAGKLRFYYADARSIAKSVSPFPKPCQSLDDCPFPIEDCQTHFQCLACLDGCIFHALP